MQKASENGSSMVGMDQCRISSIESTTSSLLEGGPSASASSVRSVPLLCSQKSRGSHSSAGSCGGHEDLNHGGGIAEVEPLLPVSSRTIDEDKKQVSAHVNKLHFELVDQCQDDTERNIIMAGNANGNDEEEDENLGKSTDKREQYNYVNEFDSDFKVPREIERMQNASNDTVCTTSSSATAATVTAASSKSSRSNGPPSNNKPGRSSNNKNKRLRHLSTDTDEASEISATLEPPDGGWGWVVVAASFLVNLIADGVTFSFGVFFMEFTTYFKESESTTAWIGSLLAAMPLLSGPIASYLTDRYGCRKVTIAGGLLAAFGFVLSSYTTSIYVLMITFGVITGFGLSLCYVAAVVIVAYYFERRRSFATGLSVCGGGIGTFLFAPITQQLIVWYGWQKTTLFLAGNFLVLCFCGLLMKDLEWTKKKNKSSNNNNSNSPHNFSQHGCNGNISCSNHQQSADKSKWMLKSKNNSRRCNSAICIPTFVQEQERRERRQRYYSYNQDVDSSGGVLVKQDLAVIDRSSPGGGNSKTRAVKTRVLPSQKDQLDSGDLLLGFGLTPAASVIPKKINNSKHNSSTTAFLTGSSVVITSDNLKSSVSPLDVENVQEPLLPHGGGELIIIPEEKDTNLKKQSTAVTGNLTGDSLHNENAEFSHAQHLTNTASILIPGSDMSDGAIWNKVETSSANEISQSSSSPLPSCNDAALRNLQMDSKLNNNNNININDKFVIVDALNLTSSTDASSPPDFNHIYHNANLNNNDSNNSSINNVNNINNSFISNGIVRNNSGSHVVCNNNSVSSFTSTTIMPNHNTAAAPNGIPTIIIPPAQQSKLSSNAKLDIMNSARYRSVMHRHSLTYRGAVLNLKRYRLRSARSCPDIISVATSVDGRGSFEMVNVIGDVCRWMRSICEWDNLMNTRFLLFILSNLLLYTWYDVPYMYLQTAAVRHGYSEDLSSYLISSIGLSNVVGNIMLGYMGDKEWASATLVYGVCMIICGATTVLMPYLMEWSFWGLFIVCGIFGLTIAANYALTSVILVQVVSLERFANAYGLLLLVQGIGNLVGPPIAGVISDMTGTNTLSFVVAGVGIFVSSFFVLAPVFYRENEPDPSNNNHQHHHHQVAQVNRVDNDHKV